LNGNSWKIDIDRTNKGRQNGWFKSPPDVELLIVPALRLNNVFVVPDWRTGKVRLTAEIFNAGSARTSSVLSFRVTDARTGMPVVSDENNQNFNKGSNSIELNIEVKDHKLWSPEDPMLYRIEVSLQSQSSVDVYSLRFGFRDFDSTVVSVRYKK
jgi:beta-galactosidase/beta-glucuronidase